MADQLIFNDDLSLLGILGTGTTTLTGTVTADYTNNTVTGSVSVTAAGSLAAQTYTNLTLTQTGTSNGQPTYELTGSSGLTNVTIDYTGQLPTTMTGSISTLLGVQAASGSGNVTSSVVCFLAGTLIRTPGGEVPIEALKVGDLVLTATGAERRIKWLSHRTIDCRRHPQPRMVMPIRILAEAFGPGLPERDLFVSPGHAICVRVVDEVLIPASALINGATVAQVGVDEVAYWHLELDAHDVLLSNGLPAESYIDVGNRAFFTEASGDIDPQTRTARLSDYCRPFVTDPAVISAVRMRLDARAINLGWSRDDSPFAGLHILADGRCIQPEVDGLTARFVLPAAAWDVWLVSETSIPCTNGDSSDDRPLGVFLRRLTVDDGLKMRRDIGLDDPLLSIGFHAVEGLPQDIRRWTSGRAHLPASLWSGCHGQFFLRVELAGPALPRWTAPAVSLQASDHDKTSKLRQLVAAA